MKDFRNPRACTDPEMYIRRCERRMNRREAEAEANINACLKGAVLLLLWAFSLALLVGAV